MSLRASLRFFTRLPVGNASLPVSFDNIFIWLPLVGIIVGLLVASTMWLASFLLPAPLSGVIGCLVWVGVTGGLHLDGVADCGDGLLVETSPQRRLEIMKDSRLGAFGGMVLFLVLALKLTALQVLAASTSGGWHGLITLVCCCCLAATLGRCAAFIANHVPSARPDGLGCSVSQGVTPRHELAALVTALAISMCNGLRGGVALTASVAVTWFVLTVARKRLGGVTGDVYGCLIELVECAVLLVCCLDTF